jgi:hypothetical protein
MVSRKSKNNKLPSKSMSFICNLPTIFSNLYETPFQILIVLFSPALTIFYPSKVIATYHTLVELSYLN